MAFTYPTVSIQSVVFGVYGTQTDADNYILGSVNYPNWLNATDDAKGQAINSATRWLDSLQWIGDKTDAANAHAWPRMNIQDVDSATLPANLVACCFELAAILNEDPDARANVNATLPKMMKAGSVTIENFRGQDVQWLGPIPPVAFNLVAAWLQGAGAAGGPTVSGTDDCSPLDKDFDFAHGI